MHFVIILLINSRTSPSFDDDEQRRCLPLHQLTINDRWSPADVLFYSRIRCSPCVTITQYSMNARMCMCADWSCFSFYFFFLFFFSHTIQRCHMPVCLENSNYDFKKKQYNDWCRLPSVSVHTHILHNSKNS